MKYADINRRYTEIVAKYIGKGYTINTASMGGSQGETCKIDLTNDTEIVRIMVDTFSDFENCLDGVEIIVGKVTDDDIHPHSNSGWTIIWNNRLEVISTERYYKIGQDSNYYGTQDEAKAASAIRLKRYIARESTRQTKNITDKAMGIAKRIIRREFSIKRICEADVNVIRYDNAYVISYRGKNYRLR